MPSEPVSLGKFKGGLNTVADDSSIEDDQLSEILNFDVDTDGSLVSRPAITLAPETTSVTGNMEILGYYVDNLGNTSAVIAVGTETRLYNVQTGVWTTVWSVRASGFVQYDNKVVLCSESAAGGYWESGVFTSTPTMPQAAGIVFYQERFWAWGVKNSANSTTVWFSKLTLISPPTSIFTWDTGADFFTVSKGDGQWITCLTPDSSALIISRSGSTWTFSFPSTPLAGTLNEVNSNIGADNQFSIVRYENYYFCVHSGTVYQLINFQFYATNVRRVEFAPESTTNPLIADIRLSVVGRRLILWHYGNTYVYSIALGAWSRWRSTVSRASHFIQVPSASLAVSDVVAYAVTGEDDPAKQKLWRMAEDPLQSGSGESITCMIRTKAYTIRQPAQYKRLFYWTAEVKSAGLVTGIAYPVVVPNQSTKWDAMDLTTWDVLALGNWDNPLVIIPGINDPVPYSSSGPISKLIQFISRFHFLKVVFEVYLECNGTESTSPARIYSITPYLAIKGGVPRKVN